MRKRYTKKEDTIILHAVKKYGYKTAMKLIPNQLHRSLSSVACRYYKLNSIRKPTFKERLIKIINLIFNK